jgi:hypothetical protein
LTEFWTWDSAAFKKINMDIATDDAILDTQWSEWTEGFL